MGQSSHGQRPDTPHGLRAALATALRDVPFYARLWNETAGRVPAEAPVLQEWPTWSVEELRASIAARPPFGDLYVEEALADLAFIHSSTGTTGKPRIFPVPRTDLPRMEQVYREHMEMMGIHSGDICAITLTFGLPRGAWSCVQAARAVGATVLPLSSGKVTPAEKLLDVVQTVGATVLQGAGSYLTYLTRRARELGFDTRGSSVRLLLTNGEALSAENRRHLEDAWHARVVMNFASTDLSWVSAECEASSARHGALGMHVTSGVVPEILDERRRPVGDGEYGELVVTSWLRPSSPRIRFRTGDRAALTHEPCPCGETSVRILPIQGRVDDAVRFHGQTIWASSVEDVLTSSLGAPVDFFLEHREHPERGSVLAVKLPSAVAPSAGDDLATTLQRTLNVRFLVEFMDDAEIVEKTGVAGTGKVRRVFDLVGGTA
ncbi:phenylacetate--CoA ligase family protein [Actinomadura decatromicini]|uniref:Phenylacetate--CoA ligase n=1 Tax=Actinomadura decatromicini TaxID=2604572 RepID=A0A5D3FW83_9ACTN|nr:AMP-binding protein [Actinomadura decatromicini]TYK51405.1 phenylacetate--CoA ligase [Actinomadura decatromicini]